MKYRILHHIGKTGLLLFVLLSLLVPGGCASRSSEADAEPVRISVWTYYNGPQLDAFRMLIDEFNETEGREKGIQVESAHFGSVTELQEKVLESAAGKVGAAPIPHVFAAYADTAYAVDELGLLTDLTPYLTDEEWAEYEESYLTEGAFSEGEIKIFPIAKSTEILLLNKTDWEHFAEECDFTYEDLSTMEGLIEVSEVYRDWSGGKAFYGRDSLSNYHFIGARQLGSEILSRKNGKVEITLDRDVMRKLWRSYYEPYVSGCFDSSGRFRSDDIKTGNILAYVGSSSGAMYFPDRVTLGDEDSHEIEMEVLPAPQFADAEPFAVQQGAGMCVTNESEEVVEASMTFLKWFTQPERNIRFSIGSGYLPVQKRANNMEAVLEVEPDLDEKAKKILQVAFSTVRQNTMYTPPAFEQGTELRDLFDHTMEDAAVRDQKAVEQSIGHGTSLEKAVAPYVSERQFESWYTGLLSHINSLFK